MKAIVSISMIILSMSVLSGCKGFERQDAGLVAGGVIGGVAGHELTGGSALGTVGGAVGGAYLGRQLTK